MQVVVDSLITTYNRSGKGRTVVLIHGWGDSLATFKELNNQLAESFDVISVDLPGFGQTQIPPEVWGLDEYSAFLNNFLEKLGVENVYAFIGHSNGGAVLIKGLSRNVLKASKLVLVASAGIRDTQKGRRAALKIVAKAGKAATICLPAKYKKILRKKLYGVAGSDLLVVPELQETFKKTVRQDVQEDAKKLNLSVLLLYGARDKATPLKYGTRFKQLMPNAELKVIEGGGHYIHQDQPQQVLTCVKEFLA